jgi:hypothetical protein
MRGSVSWVFAAAAGSDRPGFDRHARACPGTLVGDQASPDCRRRRRGPQLRPWTRPRRRINRAKRTARRGRWRPYLARSCSALARQAAASSGNPVEAGAAGLLLPLAAAGLLLGSLAGLLGGALAGAVGGLFAGVGAELALAARVVGLGEAASAGRTRSAGELCSRLGAGGREGRGGHGLAWPAGEGCWWAAVAARTGRGPDGRHGRAWPVAQDRRWVAVADRVGMGQQAGRGAVRQEDQPRLRRRPRGCGGPSGVESGPSAAGCAARAPRRRTLSWLATGGGGLGCCRLAGGSQQRGAHLRFLSCRS